MTPFLVPATPPTAAARSAHLSSLAGQLREQLLEQRGFRVDQLRSLCLTKARTGASRSSREITDSLLIGARSALRDVTAALDRMDAGCYGLCTSCGGAIPVERLEVLPQVAMCMPCQRASAIE